MVVKGRGFEVVEYDADILERFEKEAKITEESVAQANVQLEELHSEFAESLEEDIALLTKVHKDYISLNYSESALKKLLEVALRIKGNAGMFGFGFLSDVAELLFDLLDDDYNLSSPKVLKSIDIYVQTINRLARDKSLNNTSKDAQLLVQELKKLNGTLERLAV